MKINDIIGIDEQFIPAKHVPDKEELLADLASKKKARQEYKNQNKGPMVAKMNLYIADLEKKLAKLGD